MLEDEGGRAVLAAARDGLENANEAGDEERARLLEELYDALEDELDDAEAPPLRH
jgi:hypothetical protein